MSIEPPPTVSAGIACSSFVSDLSPLGKGTWFIIQKRRAFGKHEFPSQRRKKKRWNFFQKPLDKKGVLGYSSPCPLEAAQIWRRSSVGQSIRFIPEVSPVRIQSPLPWSFPGPSPWRVGQAAKTPPFHGGNTGSIPVRVTTTGGIAPVYLEA